MGLQDIYLHVSLHDNDHDIFLMHVKLDTFPWLNKLICRVVQAAIYPATNASNKCL